MQIPGICNPPRSAYPLRINIRFPESLIVFRAPDPLMRGDVHSGKALFVVSIFYFGKIRQPLEIHILYLATAFISIEHIHPTFFFYADSFYHSVSVYTHF